MFISVVRVGRTMGRAYNGFLSASTQDLSSSSATSRTRDRWLRNESTTKAEELCVRDLLSLIVARVLFPSASLNVNPFAALKISLYDVIGRAFLSCMLRNNFVPSYDNLLCSA